MIGTEFKLALVRKVAAKPGLELEPMLSELQLGEFIYEQPASGDIEYIFKHALTHDVAYNSMLNERRRVLHGRIGAALESMYPDSLDDHVAELAHHYARSGNPLKAVEYCLRAVEQCPIVGPMPKRSRSSRSGSSSCNEALAYSVSGWNLWFLGYPDRALERVNRATAIANKSGSKSVLEAVHNIAKYIFALRRELALMRETAAASLVLSTESGAVTRRALCEMFLGWADTMEGDLDGGIARMRCNLSGHRATGSELLSDYVLALIADALGRMGRFDEGLRTFDESFKVIERTGLRYLEAEVHRLKGELLLAQDTANGPQAARCFRTAIDIARGQKARS